MIVYDTFRNFGINNLLFVQLVDFEKILKLFPDNQKVHISLDEVQFKDTTQVLSKFFQRDRFLRLYTKKKI